MLRVIRQGDKYLPKDQRNVQLAFTVEGYDKSREKILYRKPGQKPREVCPYRLTSARADCYIKVGDGDGAVLWKK